MRETAETIRLMDAAEKLADGSSRTSENRSVHIVCGEDPYVHLGYTIPASPVYLRRY